MQNISSYPLTSTAASTCGPGHTIIDKRTYTEKLPLPTKKKNDDQQLFLGSCHRQPPLNRQGREGRPERRFKHRLHQTWLRICQVSPPCLPQTDSGGKPPHAPAGLLLPSPVCGQVPQTNHSLLGAEPHLGTHRRLNSGIPIRIGST